MLGSTAFIYGQSSPRKSIDRSFQSPEEYEAEKNSLWHRLLVNPYLFCIVVYGSWIAIGIVFYAYYQNWTVATAYFYTIEAGLSIGFCNPAEKDDNSKAFTIIYVLLGSSVVSGSLAVFAMSLMSSKINLVPAEHRIGAVSYRDAYGYMSFSSVVHYLWYHTKYFCGWYHNRFMTVTVLLFIVWMGIGTLYGVYVEGWTVITALYWAVSSCSTGGLQSPACEEGTDGTNCRFSDFRGTVMGVYMMIGVPIYVVTLSQFSRLAVEHVRKAQEKEALNKPIEDAEFIFAANVLSPEGSTTLVLGEYILLELMRSGLTNQHQIELFKEKFYQLDIQKRGELDLDDLRNIGHVVPRKLHSVDTFKRFRSRSLEILQENIVKRFSSTHLNLPADIREELRQYDDQQRRQALQQQMYHQGGGKSVQFVDEYHPHVIMESGTSVDEGNGLGDEEDVITLRKSDVKEDHDVHQQELLPPYPHVHPRSQQYGGKFSPPQTSPSTSLGPSSYQSHDRFEDEPQQHKQQQHVRRSTYTNQATASAVTNAAAGVSSKKSFRKSIFHYHPDAHRAVISDHAYSTEVGYDDSMLKELAMKQIQQHRKQQSHPPIASIPSYYDAYPTSMTTAANSSSDHHPYTNQQQHQQHQQQQARPITPILPRNHPTGTDESVSITNEDAFSDFDFSKDDDLEAFEYKPNIMPRDYSVPGTTSSSSNHPSSSSSSAKPISLLSSSRSRLQALFGTVIEEPELEMKPMPSATTSTTSAAATTVAQVPHIIYEEDEEEEEEDYLPLQIITDSVNGENNVIMAKPHPHPLRASEVERTLAAAVGSSNRAPNTTMNNVSTGKTHFPRPPAAQPQQQQQQQQQQQGRSMTPTPIWMKADHSDSIDI